MEVALYEKELEKALELDAARAFVTRRWEGTQKRAEEVGYLRGTGAAFSLSCFSPLRFQSLSGG